MKGNISCIRRQIGWWLLIVVLLAVPASAQADAPTPQETDTLSPAAAPEAVDWLEPQGISIVDLVGQVPDSYLSGATIVFTPGFGIVRYNSGTRSDGVVTVNATLYPRYIIDGSWNGSLLSCLGQPARIDQMGVSVPASTVRLYAGGRDVTREVDSFSYVPSGLIKPIRNPQQSETQNQYRYRESALTTTSFTADGQLIVPPNMGCELIMSYKNYRELKAVFTLKAPSPVRIQVAKVENITFHSYLGPGFRGLLDSLVNQLYQAGYRDRAESVLLTPPAGADYFFLNLPPTQMDPFTRFPGNPYGNVDRPTGGTYRVAIPPGLSIDHVNSMALPLFGHWQDIDQCKGTFLTYSRQPLRLSTPEYFVPPGIAYNSCMTHGGCPRTLLDNIFAATATAKLIYLQVDRTSANLQRIPLRMPGVSYAGTGVTPKDAPASAEPNSQVLAGGRRIYLPGIFKQVPILPADSTAGCTTMGGCGWFTADGRMMDYIPSP